MRSRAALCLLTVLGFALRVRGIGGVPLRWDEGWSVALASLPLGDLLHFTALDVHPPLYYLVLAPWLGLAHSPEVWARMPSAFAGCLAVPLAAAAASSWWRAGGRPDAGVGLAAAAYMALAPALVYYSGVTRMYAFTTPWLLLSAFGVARCTTRRSGVAAVTLGAAGALYTFYYTGFALVGLFLAGLWVWPKAWRRIVAGGALAALAFAPWAVYAAGSMAERVAERAGPVTSLDLAAAARLLDDGLFATVFAYDAGWWAVAAVLAVLVLGALFARRRDLGRLGVAVLPPAAVVLGAAAGSQAHMFAPRYVIGGTAFLGLGIGWAVASLWRRWRPAGALAAVAVLAATWPTLSGYAYARQAEVSGDYDPAALAAAMSQHGRPGDLVAFNVLSLAGAYQTYAKAGEPPWTYGQVWDPVREPDADAVARVSAAAAGHSRLWLVLYRGTASPGSAALKAWADGTLYPGEGWWTPDTLVQSYVIAQTGPPRPIDDAVFDHSARLVDAALSPTVRAGGVLAVGLSWRALGPMTRSARVFVHAYDASGALVAQHDGFAAADSRPTDTWQPGETLQDRHGLALPQSVRGPLHVVAGLYDPGTGRRWLLGDGSDAADLGTVTVEPSER